MLLQEGADPLVDNDRGEKPVDCVGVRLGQEEGGGGVGTRTREEEEEEEAVRRVLGVAMGREKNLQLFSSYLVVLPSSSFQGDKGIAGQAVIKQDAHSQQATKKWAGGAWKKGVKGAQTHERGERNFHGAGVAGRWCGGRGGPGPGYYWPQVALVARAPYPPPFSASSPSPLSPLLLLPRLPPDPPSALPFLPLPPRPSPTPHPLPLNMLIVKLLPGERCMGRCCKEESLPRSRWKKHKQGAEHGIPADADEVFLASPPSFFPSSAVSRLSSPPVPSLPFTSSPAFSSRSLPPPLPVSSARKNSQ
eukprot:751775-Hanusia_phi.AAC.3